MHQISFTLLLLSIALSPGAQAAAACDKDIGGVTLPAGFCATVFADDLGIARGIAVNVNGDVYVALQRPSHGGGIAALRMRHGDGHADVIQYFGDAGGSGIAIQDGYLYFATPTSVLRYKLTPGELMPADPPQVVVGGFPEQDEHAAKTIALDASGHLYVNVGAPSNACQQDDRVPRSPGIRPCPLLALHGGIWRYAAGTLGQQHGKDGERYATGIRNAVAITWDPLVGGLYVLQMGRDQLNDNWPMYFSTAQSAELPAEEFFAVHAGDDFGWPYCYYDQLQKAKVLAPEYGGDGRKIGECGRYTQPIAAFPGHWAPESVLFYAGAAFPARYRGGAFITFHGSWNRAPLPQAGYKLVFLPFKDGRPTGPYEVFADGFAGTDKLLAPGDAHFRPMGLAEAPDGSLYLGDTQHGRIWRIVHPGAP